MPNLNAVITDIVAGNTLKLTWVIKNIPSGESLTTAWFTVKRNKADLDDAALIRKKVTTASTADGQITDVGGADRAGQVLIISGSNDTVTLKENVTYFWDFQVRTDQGSVGTPEMGTLTAKNPITIEKS